MIIDPDIEQQPSLPPKLQLEDDQAAPRRDGSVAAGRRPEPPFMPGTLPFRYSGRISIYSLAVMLGALAAAAYAVGTFYPVFLRWSDSICLNMAACLSAAYVIAFVAASAARATDARSSLALVVTTTLAGFAAWHWSWVVWIEVTTTFGRVVDPRELIAIVSQLRDEGQWLLFGSKISGAPLAGVWLLETAVLLFGPPVISRSLFSAIPYCEKCGQWLDAPCTIQKLTPIDKLQHFRKSLRRGDFRPLGRLRKLEPTARLYTKVEVLTCPDCRTLHLLSVKQVQSGWDETRTKRVYEDAVIEHLVVTSEVSHWVRKHVGSD